MTVLRLESIAFVLLALCLVSGSPTALADAPVFKVNRLLLLDAAQIDTRLVAVGERGSVLLSDDAGKSWRRVSTPTDSTLTAVFFIDAQQGWAVGHDAVILHTRDGGETWQQQHADPDAQAPLLDVLFLTPQHGIAVGAYGSFLETEDGGTGWQYRPILVDDRHLNALARNGDRLYAAGEMGGLFVSHDQGASWQPLPSPYHGSFFGILALADGGLLAFGLRGELHRSADFGQTWQAVHSPTTQSLMGGSATNDGMVLLAGNGGTVLVSHDHGRQFHVLPQADKRALATALQVDGRILGFGEAGVLPLGPAR